MLRFKQIQTGIILLGAGMLVAFGCVPVTPAGKANVNVVKAGEHVRVNYTCRAKNQAVVDTTEQVVAEDKTIEKSRVFWERDVYVPIAIVAGKDQPDPVEGKLKPLEPEIHSRLAHAIVGKPKNRPLELVIASDVPKDMNSMNRFLTIPRVRITPVIRTITLEQFKQVNRREPKLNEVFSQDGKPYAEIIDIDSEKVSYKVLIDQQQGMESPWGRVTLGINGDSLIATIHSKVGMLVRSGGVIGRVAKVTEKSISVDYGYPFGEEQLKCTVTVLEKSETK